MIPVLHEFHSLNLMKPQQSCNYTRDFSRQITNFSFKFSDFTIFSISNFQIHFENDPGAALVSFAQPNEATAAMNSPDAVFGNRFIKMFYNYQGQAPVRERLGAITATANIGAGDSTVKERISAEGSTLTKTIGMKL